MKARLNLTIDNTVLARVKAYAAGMNTSVSELVEHYFRSIAKDNKGKSVIQIVDKLKKPSISDSINLKEEFYKNQSGKYGF
jgi:hypothetical protein